jgi:hypothetical protein
MAALESGRRLHHRADDAGAGARPLRRLDRATQGRHRQQAGRVRIRDGRGVGMGA